MFPSRNSATRGDKKNRPRAGRLRFTPLCRGAVTTFVFVMSTTLVVARRSGGCDPSGSCADGRPVLGLTDVMTQGSVRVILPIRRIGNVYLMVVMSDVTTKDRITAAATYLLTEHGAAGVSMRKVAAAVGITPMAIYQYVRDRETPLNAIADAAFVELVRRWEAAERPSQADELLREMLIDHVDFALEHPR